MRKVSVLYFLFFSVLGFNKVQAQGQAELEQIGFLLDDALFFSKQYITPATDAAVYQASSNWVKKKKKSKLWDFNVSLHGNAFFVPKSDREFKVSNDDFNFFTIEGANSAVLPTALGGEAEVYFNGQISDENPVRVKAPKGINQETIIYPYLQASLGLWKGTDFIAKYSTKVKLKKGFYQVYGVGFKHNLSQYFSKIEKSNFHISSFLGYSNEEVSFDFLDVQTDFGNLGLNQISGNVDTYQFQINASKVWKNFELMVASITNLSFFEYAITGSKGAIENTIPLQSIVNQRLSQLDNNKINAIGEVSGRYQFNKIFVQSSIAFGKFINSNISIQYQFN